MCKNQPAALQATSWKCLLRASSKAVPPSTPQQCPRMSKVKTARPRWIKYAEAERERESEGWMDGWMDEWMNGWMDEWMDGPTDGWMDEQTDEYTNEILRSVVDLCWFVWFDSMIGFELDYIRLRSRFTLDFQIESKNKLEYDISINI